MGSYAPGELHFVIPLIRFGNVCIMPQPDRSRSQDIEALYLDDTGLCF